MIKIWICLFLTATLFDGSAGLRVFQELWAQKCLDSGVIGYNATKDSLSWGEHRHCVLTTFNGTQFNEDVDAIIKNLNTTEVNYAGIQLTLQKHCAPAKAILKCNEKLSTECFTNHELLRWRMSDSLWHGMLDFFCDSDATGMTDFINENGLECLLANYTSLNLCYKDFSRYKTAALFIEKSMDAFGMFYETPKAEVLCNLIETSGNCVLQSFQHCKMSVEPARRITNLISYIETKTKCADQPKVNSVELIRQSPIWEKFQDPKFF